MANEAVDAVDAKQAVKIAFDYLHEMYNQQIEDLLLEEIERGHADWAVTVSFYRVGESPVMTTLAVAIGGRAQRVRHYKVLRIGFSGHVVSMKIRETGK